MARTIKVEVETQRLGFPKTAKFIIEVDVLPSFYQVMKELQQASEHFCSYDLSDQEQFTAHEYVRRYLLDSKITNVMMGSV